jgi:hypothetical protein
MASFLARVCIGLNIEISRYGGQHQSQDGTSRQPAPPTWTRPMRCSSKRWA